MCLRSSSVVRTCCKCPFFHTCPSKSMHAKGGLTPACSSVFSLWTLGSDDEIGRVSGGRQVISRPAVTCRTCVTALHAALIHFLLDAAAFPTAAGADPTRALHNEKLNGEAVTSDPWKDARSTASSCQDSVNNRPGVNVFLPRTRGPPLSSWAPAFLSL